VDLEALLANPPVTHLDGAARPYPMGVDPEILALIDRHVDERSHTLETGAGLSTALFAIKGGHHTCIVPWQAEADRLTDWCRTAGVSTDRVSFHVARSEDVLPRLEATPLDLVLIDGGHEFPVPFIDWHYAGRRLRDGGILIVDDTQLWTGRVLKRFLQEQPGWEMLTSVPMRSAVFQRRGEEEGSGDWTGQPFVARRSWNRGVRGTARTAARAVHVLRSQGWGALRERAASWAGRR
jgi:hypothetical protein